MFGLKWPWSQKEKLRPMKKPTPLPELMGSAKDALHSDHKDIMNLIAQVAIAEAVADTIRKIKIQNIEGGKK